MFIIRDNDDMMKPAFCKMEFTAIVNLYSK